MVRKGLGLLDLTETKRKDGRPKTTAKTEHRQNIKNDLNRRRVPIPRNNSKSLNKLRFLRYSHKFIGWADKDPSKERRKSEKDTMVRQRIGSFRLTETKRKTGGQKTPRKPNIAKILKIISIAEESRF